MSKQPSRRALIVVDVQNLDHEFHTRHSSVQDSLSKIEFSMDLATQSGIPIVIAQHVFAPEAPMSAQGLSGVELHRRIGARYRDLLLTKNLPSCFAGTRLGEWLDDRSIDTLVIVGHMTQECCRATIIEASRLGYQVELLDDATVTLLGASQAGRADAAGWPRVTQSTSASVMSIAEWTEALKSRRDT